MSLRIREPFNALSHLVGAVLTAIGASYLVLLHQGVFLAWFGFAIYGVMATTLFAASAAYHWSVAGEHALRKFDHASIYLMIAGTYTPVCLLAMQGSTRITVLSIEWGFALIGIAATFVMAKPPTWLRLTLYLVMGWITLPILGSLASVVSWTGVAWMLAGGLVYTLGTVVYAAKRPNPWPDTFGSHGLWHLFVVGGAACHFVLMFYLVP
ncbi:MAG: PAQR family membrane homeostasis protein TrhA [Fimbriimonas sp.]